MAKQYETDKNILLLQHGVWRRAKYPYLPGVYRYAGFASGIKQTGS